MAVTSLRWLAALSASIPAVYANAAVPTGVRDIAVIQQRAPEPTNGPVARNLQKRAGEVCGYISGDLDNPVQCATSGVECRVNSAASAIGCCGGSNCVIWTACIPSASAAVARTADLDRTLYCSGSDRPHCATLVYVDSEWLGWTINSCAAAPTTIPVIDVPSSLTVTTGRIPFTSLEPVDTRTRTNPTDRIPFTSFEPIDTSTRTSPADRAGFTGGPEVDDDGNPIQPAKSSGPPIGAIVGGVVGGVVFLALVGLLIFFLVKSSKKKNLQQAAPVAGPGGAPPAQPMYAPGPQGPQPPNNMAQAPPMGAGFGGYDNKPPVMNSVTPVPHGIVPTGSPPPLYNQTPVYNQTPSPGAGYPSPPQPVSPQFTGQQPVSPQFTGQQPVSPQYTGQSQQPSPFQPHAQPAPHQQPPQQNAYANASELPTQRGDGQLHEVA